jgi:hypothetical protein
MKQTIGRYINLNDNEFPLVLNFNDFYYYETVTGEHLLLHTISGKKAMDFYFTSDKYSILELINQRFGMDIELISIDGLYSATINSEYIRSGAISGETSFMMGTMKFDLYATFNLPETNKDEPQKNILNLGYLPDSINIQISLDDTNGVNQYARPPTK